MRFVVDRQGFRQYTAFEMLRALRNRVQSLSPVNIIDGIVIERQNQPSGELPEPGVIGLFAGLATIRPTLGQRRSNEMH